MARVEDGEIERAARTWSKTDRELRSTMDMEPLRCTTEGELSRERERQLSRMLELESMRCRAEEEPMRYRSEGDRDSACCTLEGETMGGEEG